MDTRLEIPESDERRSLSEMTRWKPTLCSDPAAVVVWGENTLVGGQY